MGAELAVKEGIRFKVQISYPEENKSKSEVYIEGQDDPVYTLVAGPNPPVNLADNALQDFALESDFANIQNEEHREILLIAHYERALDAPWYARQWRFLDGGDSHFQNVSFVLTDDHSDIPEEEERKGKLWWETQAELSGM